MRSFTFLAGVLAATFVAAAAAADRAPRSLDPDARLDAAIQVAQQRGQAQRATVLDNFKFVGHSDLGGDIDFGDVWAHGDYAYVGSRCGDEALGGGGVRVVDISHPTHPTVVSTLVNDEFTRAEDVVVPACRRHRSPATSPSSASRPASAAGTRARCRPGFASS